MKRFLILILVLGLSPSWTLAGTKEELIRLQSDVLQLQNQIRLLQKSYDENQGILRSLLEQLNDQVARNNLAMDSLSQAIRGQKADLGSTLTQFRNELQNLSIKLDDTNNRIGSLHQKMEENQLRINSIRSVPSAQLGGTVEPDQVYSASYNDYLMGNYELAIAGFQDFLSHYPESEYADNAAYYLGDSQLKQRRYEDALLSFDQVINLFPKGDKTAVAYYKKGGVLLELQRLPEAIDTFRKLVRLFPETAEANLARNELERLGAG